MQECHNPYFNRWFSAIKILGDKMMYYEQVTILILIDGFLQYITNKALVDAEFSHNPYFNRWFSAICLVIYGATHTKKSQSLF